MRPGGRGAVERAHATWRRASIAGVPVIGIGGISSHNAGPVIAAGAVGVAVVSAILRAVDPALATRDLARVVGEELARKG